MSKHDLVENPMIGSKGKRIGRPRLHPPDDAAARIEACTADGFSQVGVARALGASTEIFRRWLDDDPTLREAFDRGRERERHALHNMLYRSAMEGGNPTAAMFLLKARHGYREGDQGEQGNRVQITFTLPGALKPDQFVVESHVPSTETLALPRTSLERS